jgi:hypothetical protein
LLCVGYLNNLNITVVCATLKRAYNLTFFVYKPLPYYPLIINVVTKQLYYLYLRCSKEYL